MKGKRWLLLPGRITRWKGHADFIRMIGSLVEDNPDVQGVIVGGGRVGSRYRTELDSLATKTGIGERITFTGSRLDIRYWMSTAEMVFNLSNNPPEAFGRTVLESLCLGCPVIAWDHGGASEILAGMFPAGTVSPLDYEQLEARARDFLASRPVVQESDAFSLKTSMEKHLSAYRSLVKNHHE